MSDAGNTLGLRPRELIERLRNLHSLYAHLTNQYARLPLVHRRYLYGSHTQSTQEVRALAQAKFVLAATLQWLPSTWQYNAENLVAAVGHVEKKLGDAVHELEDELCPIWLDFFHEIAKLDHLLIANQPEVNTASLSMYWDAEMLLDAAEKKYAWLFALIQVVAQTGGWERRPGGVELTGSIVTAGWNRFCMRVASGMNIDEAAATVRPTAYGHAMANECIFHAGRNAQREYFAFIQSIDYEPWEVPEAESGEFHPHCTSSSPCRRPPNFCPCKARGTSSSPCRGPPNFCPCKARGQVCDNSNCMQSGGYKWRCEFKEPEPDYYGTPSYAASCLSIEEALKADQVFDGGIYEKQEVSQDPLMPRPTAIMQTYNAYWNSLTPSEHYILWPTPSFGLDDMNCKAGLLFDDHDRESIPLST